MIDYDIQDNSDQVIQDILKVERRAGNLSAPLRAWGDYWKGETKRQFDRGVDPDGRRWQPLAPSTILQKMRKGYPLTPLVASGRMSNAAYVRGRGESVEVGIADALVEVHQRGTDKIPPREIVGFGSNRLERLTELIDRHITGG